MSMQPQFHEQNIILPMHEGFNKNDFTLIGWEITEKFDILMTLSPGQEMTLTLINYMPSLALVVSIEQLSSFMLK